MLKKILFIVLPLLLPAVAYILWVYFARRHSARPGVSRWRNLPWVWLAAAGLGLMVVSLVSLALFTGHDIRAVYTPAKYIDGELIPGKTE